MIRVAVVGLGKMGLSHLALFRTHPSIKVAAVCDTTKYLTDVLARYAALQCYNDFHAMLDAEELDALIVATPSPSHAAMVRSALDRGLHVFCEKPFVLDVSEGERLVALAHERRLVNQVGYHYRFVGAFKEAARIARSGGLGKVHHVRAEAFGPVVLRHKGATWRSVRDQGGGALYDYACHAIDLVNFIAGPPASASGVIRQPIFSKDVDDEIYCSLRYLSGMSGQLSVNWSDESYRKMFTRISVWGTNGRVDADRQECRLYLREPHPSLPGYDRGWTVRYTTDLTDEVWYYLRGEEYSAQVAYFAESIAQQRLDGENTFRSALEADRVVQMILAEGGVHAPTTPLPPSLPTRRKRFLARLFDHT